MNWDILIGILAVLAPVGSAVLVAVLNNWDKINPSKRRVKDLYEKVNQLHESVNVSNDCMKEIGDQVDTISSALRTSLQTHILASCKTIQDAIDAGDTDYEENLKQLIILYREYHLCGYNSQGRLYFNDTINRAAEDNNTLVHTLMNNYFSEYDPDMH